MERFVALALVGVALSACGRDEKPAGSNRQAGSGGNAGGSGGTSGSGGTGGSEDLLAVAQALDGFVMTAPCVASSGPRACRTHPPGPCPRNRDPARAGALPTDATLALGGTPGTYYDVTLHVQGIVEPKVYRGGTDASDLPTNGFLVQGAIDNSKSQHTAYALRVTAPPASYFFNSLGRENLRHSVFAVDYEATITMQAGTPLALTVSDPNCEALRNCGDPDVPTECVPLDVPNLEPKIREKLGRNPPDYDGQFLGFVVKTVTVRN